MRYVDRLFTLIIAAILLGSCLGTGSGDRPDPVLTLDPNATTPLAAQLELSTEFESTVTVTITDGSEATVLSFDDPATDHTLPLLGFKPDGTYTLLIQALDALTGNVHKNYVRSLTTDPLPAEFPEIVLEAAIPERMEPGYTMFTAGNFMGTPQRIIVVDNEGEVVWYYLNDQAVFDDLRQLENGNLLFIMNRDVVEMDMLGNIINRYRSTAPGDTLENRIPVDDTGLGFHHEVFPTLQGTYMTLGFETSEVNNFPLSETDQEAVGTTTVTDDTVLEFSSDGTVQDRWSLQEVIDPHRISYDSLNDHFIHGTPNDWAHANAVIPDGDTFIVSMRHQDAVIKFHKDTGELIWILGNHENWAASFQQYLLQPVGSPFEWSYHQHAPEITASGNLLLFDNGNYRASPFDGTTPMTPDESYSRAVAYSIDEVSMTAEQIWEYGSSIDPVLYAPFLCDADQMGSTRNVLITFGGLMGIGEQSSSDMGRGMVQARLLEVDRSGSDDVVFDLSVYGLAADTATGWMVYRSERIPDLYR